MSRFRFVLLPPLALAGCSSAPPFDIRVGAVVPAFDLQTLDGETVEAPLTGDLPVILNFWATWCGPCRSELPALKAVHDAGRARVIGIALDENGAAAVRPFVARNRIPYTVMLGDQALFQRFQGQAIPYTLILDSSGTIVAVHRGATDQATLERDLAAL